MSIKGIRFLSNRAGETTGVVIDLRRHRRLWEDFYDTRLLRAAGTSRAFLGTK